MLLPFQHLKKVGTGYPVEKAQILKEGGLEKGCRLSLKTKVKTIPYDNGVYHIRN